MEKFVAYIIEDSEAESLVDDNDVEGFRQYVIEESCLDYDCIEFDSEEERSGFLRGFFHGCDERAPAGKVVLLSGEECYEPFIEILENL
ncbi:MAG: hypothetical protein J6C81_06430 [Muribaculaceae bacterium]|nr:hypothetical protein [Muribaculaceae bacterium]